MSVQAVQSSQQVAQAEASAKAPATQKQASQNSAIPEDKVTISAAARAKQTAPATSATTDTVQIANAAQAALKEATETPTQTAKEAQSGDRQAQKLLAKESAAK
jgi:hypothetical protein